MNRHFVRTDDGGVVLYGFSTTFEQPQEGDVCIAEEAGYQFQLFGLENPPLRDELGVPLYKLEDGAVVARTEDEMAPEREAEQAKRDALAAAEADNAAMLQASVALAQLKASDLPDDQAVQVAALFEAWAPGRDYKTGDRRREGAQLYRCLQAHTSQAGWEPSATPALWVEVADPAEEWPLIPDPIPATAPFMRDQKGRTADGRRWVSLIDNNVWQPEEYPAGWGLV